MWGKPELVSLEWDHELESWPNIKKMGVSWTNLTGLSPRGCCSVIIQ